MVVSAVDSAIELACTGIAHKARAALSALCSLASRQWAAAWIAGAAFAQSHTAPSSRAADASRSRTSEHGGPVRPIFFINHI